MEKCKILTIIVTYNAMRWCSHCLDSVLSSTITSDLFIVDNGSSDGTVQYIKDNYPSAILIVSNANLGFGKANNMGFEYALKNGYDYVYLLNQDAWIQENTLGELIKLSTENPEYGIISPMQLQANLQKIDTNFRKALESIYKDESFLENFYFHNKRKILPINQIQAAHWFLPISCIKKVGFFSPSFPHYGEDNNFSQRVWYHGLKVGVATSLQVIHDREDRQDSIEKKHYLEYIKKITYSSNPLVSPHHQLFSMFGQSICRAIKYRSCLPITYCYRFFCNYNQIIKNKALSLKESAFIQ